MAAGTGNRGEYESDEVIRRLLDDGASYRELGDRYGVTRQAVMSYCKNRGLTKPGGKRSPGMDHSGYLWNDMTEEDGKDGIARAFRVWHKIEEGENPSDSATTRNFIQNLIELDFVVAYSREGGFRTVRRNSRKDRPGVYIRKNKGQ